MKITTIRRNNVEMARITDTNLLITDAGSALDLMATVTYDTNCRRMIIDKEAICEDFFILSTGLAGEVLQKYNNYGVKIAIVGDFSRYTSKPLKDFIYECNKGKDIFFVSAEEDAIFNLSK